MSAMYEAYWGLREAPFEGAPNPKFLYLSPGHEEALARLVRAVAARQGAALLSGEPGCGKTVLSRALLHRLPPARFVVWHPCRMPWRSGTRVRVMAERAKG